MANYKRFISYIYQYEKGIKGPNMGFARVESRNGACRVAIHVRGVFLGQNEYCKIYGLIRRREKLVGVYLGEAAPMNGIMEYKINTPSNNIAGSIYSFSQIIGIYLDTDREKVYATGWDDMPIHLSQFTLRDEEEPENQLHAAEIGVGGADIEEVNVEEAAAREVDTKEVESSEADMKEVKSSEADMKEVKSSEADMKEVKSSEVDMKEVESSEADMKEVESSEADIKEVESGEVDGKESDVAKVDVKEVESSEVDVKEAAASEAEVKKEALYMQESAVEESVEVEKPDDLSSEEMDSTDMEDTNISISSSSDASTTNITEADIFANENLVANTREERTLDKKAFMEYMESKNHPDRKSQYTNAESDSIANNPNETYSNAKANTQTIKIKRDQERKNSNTSDRYITPEDKWNRLCRIYRRIKPFQDNEVIDCIQIEPKDLVHLQREEWVLGNNSFLLHGYYNYRYLIMGKMEINNKIVFILGVPGVFENQEKFMANMFGFSNFKPANSATTQTGEFGYWYRIVR